MVSSYLDGFGVMVNHSDTNSQIILLCFGFSNVAVSSANIPLPVCRKKLRTCVCTMKKMVSNLHGQRVSVLTS